ncbi:MAG: hypothetical protein IT544_02855 [Rhodobacteraceae bacterium]|nr:hypothetical protein [Paracoccaceae bacterium]
MTERLIAALGTKQAGAKFVPRVAKINEKTKARAKLKIIIARHQARG